MKKRKATINDVGRKCWVHYKDGHEGVIVGFKKVGLGHTCWFNPVSLGHPLKEMVRGVALAEVWVMDWEAFATPPWWKFLLARIFGKRLPDGAYRGENDPKFVLYSWRGKVYAWKKK